MNPRRSLTLVPVVAVIGALATPAQGATVGSPDACVRVIPNLRTFGVFADGFAPGAFLNFAVDGSSVGSGQADAAGHFDNSQNPADRFYPPILPGGRDIKTFQLTADDGAGVVAGPVPVTVSNVVVRAPSNAKPSKRVRFRAFGFLPDQRVYLHIRRNGKTKGRFSLGRTNAPCGLVTKKMRFMPLRHWRFGTYRYYFSHSKRFKRKDVIYAARVRLYRTFSRAAAAQATAAGAWD